MNRTVERTLAILELIANSENGITLQEIAQAMDMAKSSAFVVVHSLLELQYIKTVENNDKKYCLDIRTFSLGMKYVSDLTLIKQCGSYLPALAEKYNKTAFVGVLNGTQVVYLYKYVGRNARLATCAIGSSKPVYATSLGKVILAYLPREEQLSIIDKIKFVPFTPYTIVSKDDLLKELDSIRQKGYATENRELGEFTFCYGVPVFDHKGNVIASISLSDIALSDQDASEIVADLKAAASKFPKLPTIHCAKSISLCTDFSCFQKMFGAAFVLCADFIYIFLSTRQTPNPGTF